MKISIGQTFWHKLALALCATVAAVAIHAPQASAAVASKADASELDPFAPNVEQQLKEFDEVYERETGISAFLPEDLFGAKGNSCVRQSCPVWARVVKSQQMLYLYLDGALATQWSVSTGIPGRETPKFEKHPDGRIYTRYTSGKFPGGDYNGLGNMPYAVFISGGFALHGTPKGNWGKLGKKASHGCIRQHPEYAQYFNSLVRQNGIQNVWISVE